VVLIILIACMHGYVPQIGDWVGYGLYGTTAVSAENKGLIAQRLNSKGKMYSKTSLTANALTSITMGGLYDYNGKSSYVTNMHFKFIHNWQ